MVLKVAGSNKKTDISVLVCWWELYKDLICNKAISALK